MSKWDHLNPTGAQLARTSVPDMDGLLGLQFPVLDHGFVRVVDYMGSDASIVQAARVSYGSGTSKKRTDEQLVRYLIRHWHLSPLEMCEVKLHVKLPIFVARHWIRHRTANINEISGRYSVLEKEFYLPTEQDFNLQDTEGRQGRGEETLSAEDTALVLTKMKAEALDVFQNYEHYSTLGLSREVSRINLPLSTYTQWYWKIDLRNLLHFLHLRMSKGAQLEIRRYAELIHSLVKIWVPTTCAAFTDYMAEGLHLSRQDRIVIQKLLAQNNHVHQFDLAMADLDVSAGERSEILVKMRSLGFLPKDSD